LARLSGLGASRRTTEMVAQRHTELHGEEHNRDSVQPGSEHPQETRTVAGHESAVGPISVSAMSARRPRAPRGPARPASRPSPRSRTSCGRRACCRAPCAGSWPSPGASEAPSGRRIADGGSDGRRRVCAMMERVSPLSFRLYSRAGKAPAIRGVAKLPDDDLSWWPVHAAGRLIGEIYRPKDKSSASLAHIELVNCISHCSCTDNAFLARLHDGSSQNADISAELLYFSVRRASECQRCLQSDDRGDKDSNDALHDSSSCQSLVSQTHSAVVRAHPHRKKLQHQAMISTMPITLPAEPSLGGQPQPAAAMRVRGRSPSRARVWCWFFAGSISAIRPPVDGQTGAYANRRARV